MSNPAISTRRWVARRADIEASDLAGNRHGLGDVGADRSIWPGSGQQAFRRTKTAMDLISPDHAVPFGRECVDQHAQQRIIALARGADHAGQQPRPAPVELDGREIRAAHLACKDKFTAAGSFQKLQLPAHLAEPHHIARVTGQPRLLEPLQLQDINLASVPLGGFRQADGKVAQPGDQAEPTAHAGPGMHSPRRRSARMKSTIAMTSRWS